MSPLAAFVSILVALGIGFWLGRAKGQGSGPDLADPEVAHDFAEQGRRAVQERVGRRKERIMERARRTGKVTNDNVEDLFCIADSTARHYLNELEAEGKLRQVGERGPDVYYVPTP